MLSPVMTEMPAIVGISALIEGALATLDSVAAHNRYVLAFDNVGRMSDAMSNSLCRVILAAS